LDKISSSLGEKAKETISTLKSSIQEIDSIFKGEKGLTLLKDGRSARALLDLIGITVSGVGLLEQAHWTQTCDSKLLPKEDQQTGDVEVELEAARRWVLGTEGMLYQTMIELRELSEKTLNGSQSSSQDLEKRLVFAKL